MPKNAEFHQKMLDGWEAAKQAKAERRRENREGWATNPLNAHQARRQMVDATGPELPAAPSGTEDHEASASLKRLRAIMADARLPLFKRISAAEIVIQYELAPGSVAGSDPDQIAASSFQFLRAVADNEKTPEALLFRALKCIAQVENTRAQARNAGESLADRRRMLVRLANAERRRLLHQAGKWRAVIDGNLRWALEVDDAIDWPQHWLSAAWSWPPSAISSGYDRGDATSFKAQLLAIRARNRDDPFDALLAGMADIPSA